MRIASLLTFESLAGMELFDDDSERFAFMSLCG